MPERHILIVAVDGLRASALGAYGNTAFSTSALDELAAESFLFDSCFAPTADLAGIYRALWQSRHPLRPQRDTGGATILARLLAERGYHSTLVTDEPRLAAMASAGGFDQCVQVDSTGGDRAEDFSQTSLARLFSEACAVIESPHDAPQLVWVHAQGMYGAWDAPLELQQSLLDENDLPPIESATPPDFSVTDADDPDTAFRYSVAYAAQVMVLDACWQAVDDALRSAGAANEWLVMLLGTRGLSLGEHRRVGGVDPRLYVEQVHVPWLIRFPDGVGRLARSSQLVSHLDLAPTILEWIGGDASNSLPEYDGASALPLVDPRVTAWREAIVFGDADERRAIRTRAWSLLYDRPSGGAGSELFVRPDDRWEANDVAALCPEIVDGLVTASDAIAARIEAGEPMSGELLAEELRTSVG